jgi:histidinol-phosphate/aromatic aminotransferase/cobyric acid decarboxylase-like protein
MNPFAPDMSQLVAKAALEASPVKDYPDSSEVAGIMADHLGVARDRFLLTNGGAEAISIVAAIERRGEVVEPEFSLYRRHLSEVSPFGGRWRSNPSNPLGRLAQADEVARVWDEAFFPLATGRWTRGDDSTWRLGSLTKLWSCPGLRIGYVIAPTVAEAEAVRRIQPRWSVNGLALAVVPEALARTDLVGWSTKIARLRARLCASIDQLGFAARETEANWILVDGEDLRNRLAQVGVLVRDCSSFGMHRTVRVGLPSTDQFDQVVSAFERIA